MGRGLCAVWGPPAAPRAVYGGRGCAPPWDSVAEQGRARAVRGVWGAAGRGPGPPGGGSRCRAWYRGGVVCAPRPRLNSRGENCPAARHPPLRGTRGRLPQPALLRGAARRCPALPNPPLLGSALPLSLPLRRAFCTRRPSGSRATSTSPTTKRWQMS